MRFNAAASDANKDLNVSEFNNSASEGEEERPVKLLPKTEIGSQMSKILVDF
jgi:hypothetical protein